MTFPTVLRAGPYELSLVANGVADDLLALSTPFVIASLKKLALDVSWYAKLRAGVCTVAPP